MLKLNLNKEVLDIVKNYIKATHSPMLIVSGLPQYNGVKVFHLTDYKLQGRAANRDNNTFTGKDIESAIQVNCGKDPDVYRTYLDTVTIETLEFCNNPSIVWCILK